MNPNPSFEQTRKFPLFAGLFAATGGVLGMIGWVADIPRLIDWDGNAITIKFNAALALSLMGVALAVKAYSEALLLFIRVPAVLTILIGTATLFQHLTDIDLGIDNVFVHEAPGAPATSAPGRMGMPASISFIFLGLALLLSTSRWRKHVGKAAIVALSYSFLTLIGYLFGADPLYSLPKFTGIALQTAVGIFALSLGVASLYRHSWPMNLIVGGTAGARMFREVFPLALLIVFSFGVLNSLGYRAGFYEPNFGIALRTLLEILFIAAILSWVATRLTAQEKEIEAGFRIRAENKARKLVADTQEAERRRLARDLHDHLGQAVTAVRFRVAYLKSQNIGGEGWKALDEIESVANDLDRDMSLLAWELRPVTLDTHGLRTSLDEYLKAWGDNRHIETKFLSHEDFPRLGPEMEINLYRIVQESLNNVLKHARASRVFVSLKAFKGSVWLAIEDDGKGFDHSIAAGGSIAEGLGIGGMRERAVLINGVFEIESFPGRGTTVGVRVPFAGPDSDSSDRPKKIDWEGIGPDLRLKSHIHDRDPLAERL